MKNALRNQLALLLALVLLIGTLPAEATEQFGFPLCPLGCCTELSRFDSVNYRNLSMTPGRNETEMRFTWHSPSDTGSVRYRVLPDGEWLSEDTTSRVVPTEGGGGVWRAHQPILRGLIPDSEYQYYITWEGGRSQYKSFRTGGASEFSFFVVSDPQLNSSTYRDRWVHTMSVASAAFPHAQFVMTMGDQLASTTTPARNNLTYSQRWHNYLFTPPELHRLPFAPVVGNHDAYSNATVHAYMWHYHYNTPIGGPLNLQNEHGVRRFTGGQNRPPQFDYYFRYGDVLFIVLAVYDYHTQGGENATASSIPGRRAWFRSVIDTNQDAKWRVAAFHMPTYSAERPTSQGAKRRVRGNWIPLFEETGIDIAFMGHEHLYSRTHHMMGAGGLHNLGTVVPQQNWWPGQSGHTVIDPDGLTHIAFGSPSLFNLRAPTNLANRPYIAAVHDQNILHDGARRTMFSVVDVTPDMFSVSSFRIDGTGLEDNTITMVDVYTIVRGSHAPGTRPPPFDQTPRPVLPEPPPVCCICGEVPCVCPPPLCDDCDFPVDNCACVILIEFSPPHYKFAFTSPAATSTAAIAMLPQYACVTTGPEITTSPVALSWSLAENFDPAPGGKNLFTWELELPRNVRNPSMISTSGHALAINYSPPPPEVRITFNPNGGEFAGSEYRIVGFGESVGVLPRATSSMLTREGYRFIGWFEHIEGKRERWYDYDLVTSNAALYAKWTKTPPGFMLGDADTDGHVTSADATRIARLLVDRENVNTCPLASDVNGDGLVSTEDIVLLARWLVGHNVRHLLAHT